MASERHYHAAPDEVGTGDQLWKRRPAELEPECVKVGAVRPGKRSIEVGRSGNMEGPNFPTGRTRQGRDQVMGNVDSRLRGHFVPPLHVGMMWRAGFRPVNRPRHDLDHLPRPRRGNAKSQHNLRRPHYLWSCRSRRIEITPGDRGMTTDVCFHRRTSILDHCSPSSSGHIAR
jgi:hypothetical protein